MDNTTKPINTTQFTTSTSKENLFSSLYDAFSEPHLLFDSTGSLIAMNQAAEQFFMDEPIPHGKKLSSLLHQQNIEILMGQLESIAPSPLKVELKDLSLDAKLQQLITPGLALNQQLLLVLDTSKKDETSAEHSFHFLSQITTELKTPLNAIIGFAEMMKSAPTQLSPLDIKEFSSEIHKAGGHTLSVIRYISDIAQIKSGQFELEIKSVDCHLLLDECLEQLNELARGKNINIIRSYQQSNLVSADEYRLKQVLTSLLSNAIKYNCDDGRITIRCRPNDHGEFVISISDTGKGLEPQQLEQLFVPFKRFNASAAGIEGAGLGLATAKQLVTKMGGKIWAKSQLNKGSTFFVSLPCPCNLAHP